MNSQSQQLLRSQSRVIARHREEERVLRFRRLLAISVMSALTLGAVFLARAESWVTVNPDGSVTRTQTQTRSAAQTSPPDDATRATQRALDDGEIYDTYPQDTYPQQPTNIYNGNVYNGNVYNVYGNQPVQSTPNPGTVTFYSGTVAPYGYGYGYGSPYAGAGVTYRLGWCAAGPYSPTLRVFPTVPLSSFPGYAPGCSTPYPAPVFAYPNYNTSGVYYSGPIGGGGTIFSSTTSSSNGFGVNLGNNGLNISIGNHRSNKSSSTTVVTTGKR
jgi:hypothetical protein